MKIEILHQLNPDTLGRSTPGKDKVLGKCHIGVNPISGSHDLLLISERQVIWYEGLDPSIQSVRKVYSAETNILKAFWCCFTPEHEEEGCGSVGGAKEYSGVCIWDQECLGLCMESGAVHYVTLPFQVKEVWPLAHGILVERLIGANSAYDGLPTLFSLMHPMDDLCPLTYRRPAANATSVSLLGFFGEPGVEVLSVCAKDTPSPLVLTYSVSTQRYSIGTLRPATAEDIPSHLTTPQRPHSTLATPTDKPLSVSDPVCYGNEATPSGMMSTPVEMVLSSTRRPRPSTGLPALTRLQQQVAVEGSGGSDVKTTGRSPFISRLQTPAKEGFLKKCSKSLSPTNMPHMSPFSQTVDSKSWSTLYSEEFSFGSKFEPLYPQLCLHNLWTSDAESQHVAATDMFYTRDLVGCGYVGVVTPPTRQLWLVRRIGEGKSLRLVTMETISGVQAVPLFSLSVMLVLDCEGGLGVFSGPIKMCCIDLQGLLTPSLPSHCPTPSQYVTPSRCPVVTGVSDTLDCTFTLTLQDNTALRCALSPPPHHPLVELSLSAMKHLLPEPLARRVLCQYCTSSWSSSPSQQLPHFISWLTAALGLTSAQGGGVAALTSSQGGGVAAQLGQGGGHETANLLHQLPALKLILAKGTGALSASGSEIAMDTSSEPDTGVAMETVCSLVDHKERVALALHLVYEEFKLYPNEWSSLSELAALLTRLADCLGWQQYVDHYQRDFPSLFRHPSTSPPATPITTPTPNIQHWLSLKLQDSQPSPFPVIPEVSKRTIQLIKLYSLLMCEGCTVDLSSVMRPLSDHTPLPPPDLSWASPDRLKCVPEQRVVLCMMDEGLTISDLESFPVGVALPLLDCIQRCREAPPTCWSIAAYDLIGRHDISMTLESTSTLTTPTLDFKGDSDGMSLDLEVLKLRFPQDLRAKEVRRLLQSAEPVRISITQKPEVSDHDFIQQQETHLLALCQRTMSLSVGRGMFTLSTVRPLPTSPLSIPPLNLSGRAPPRNATVGLDHVDRPMDMPKWAEFHNGVASGLRLAPSSSKLDAAWIMFNRPGTTLDCSNTYAGFLMALGLTGHLASLQDYDLYTYLQDKHELMVVGVILGVAAANCGRAVPSLVSLLSVYLPPLLPVGSADMEISHHMQTAALIGVGLLHMGSANRHMVDVMLEEIGHAPGPELEFAEDRESYSLSAGLALGTIMLGLGESSSRDLVDSLLLLMNGGRKREGTNHAPSGPSHLVMEGELINTHVTAPGAIVALGLMYLKTNNRTVAVMLDVPKTLYGLECVRSDFLMLRTLSGGLVMWDSIEPTQDWIDQQIPSVIHEGLANKDQEGRGRTSDLETLYQAKAYITAGCCLAIAFRFAGTCAPKPYKCLLSMVRQFMGVVKGEELMGKHCIEQCLLTVLLGVAMVMSGSGDLEVLRVIRRLHVRVGHSEVTYGSHLATHMALGLLFLGSGRHTLTTSNESVAALLCSLYPCFPNTSLDNRYHLQALRHLYVLAARPGVLVTRDVDTGHARCVQLQVKVQGGGVSEMVTPCLIQDWDKLEEIVLTNSEYWPMTLQLSTERGASIRKSLSQSGLLYVREKSLTKEVRVASGTLLVGGAGGCGLGSVRGKVCLPDVKGTLFQSGLPTLLSHQDYAGSKFMTSALLHCLQQEKLLAFTAYLQLEQCLNQVTKAPPDHTHTQLLWQLKLASAYIRLYSAGATPTPWKRGVALISEDYVRGLELHLWEFLRQKEQLVNVALKSYLGVGPSPEGVWSHNEEVLIALTEVLVWYGVPLPALLDLSPQSKLPDVFVRMQTLRLGTDACGGAVRLMSVLSNVSAT